MKLILASASERRIELLKRITEKFEVIVSNFDEDKVELKGNITDYVMELSKGKAKNVADSINYDAIIIGCDTLVAIDNEILGKPSSEEDAFHMLNKLSGKEHKVYSGITIINTTNNELIQDYVVTKVKFSNLLKDDILKYVKSGETMDKAGAYGIQGYAGTFVEKIEGCYYSVVGLPLNKLNKMLREMGINLG
jgi:septum formation protein